MNQLQQFLGYGRFWTKSVESKRTKKFKKLLSNPPPPAHLSPPRAQNMNKHKRRSNVFLDVCTSDFNRETTARAERGSVATWANSK
jgi:hypothetical protein